MWSSLDSLKNKLSYLLILGLVGLVMYFGSGVLEGRKYYFISLLLIFIITMPVLFRFENRKSSGKEIVLIGVMTSIAIASRQAFFMIPQFKPVAAIVIISGICLGKENGFLVGGLSAFGSNFFFGQGPWTPWQLVGFGLLGFLAGLLTDKGLLKSRLSISIYGFLSTLIVYGLVLNFGSMVMSMGDVGFGSYKAFILAGLPFDLIHGASTFLFLFILSKPMMEKLDRIKVKYGLIDRV